MRIIEPIVALLWFGHFRLLLMPKGINCEFSMLIKNIEQYGFSIYDRLNIFMNALCSTHRYIYKQTKKKKSHFAIGKYNYVYIT